MSEAKLRKQVMKYLQNLGYVVVFTANEYLRERFKSQNFIPGLPDLIVFGQNNMHFFIELKIGKNKLSKAQQEIIEKLRIFGHKVFVVYSLEDLEEALKTLSDEKA